MEQITKKQFIEALTDKKIALIFGGYITRDQVFNNLDKIRNFDGGIYDRYLAHKTGHRLGFWTPRGFSWLYFDTVNDGNKFYQEDNILIREELHKDYKPNIVIYKTK